MNEFITYLSNSIENVAKKEQELISNERKDEANLQKIRANIYGICHTIFEVVLKSKSGEELEKEIPGISGLIRQKEKYGEKNCHYYVKNR